MIPGVDVRSPRWFITWTNHNGKEIDGRIYDSLPAAYADAVYATRPDDKAKPRIRIAWWGWSM